MPERGRSKNSAVNSAGGAKTTGASGEVSQGNSPQISNCPNDRIAAKRGDNVTENMDTEVPESNRNKISKKMEVKSTGKTKTRINAAARRSGKQSWATGSKDEGLKLPVDSVEEEEFPEEPAK